MGRSGVLSIPLSLFGMGREQVLGNGVYRWTEDAAEPGPQHSNKTQYTRLYNGNNNYWLLDSLCSSSALFTFHLLLCVHGLYLPKHTDTHTLGNSLFTQVKWKSRRLRGRNISHAMIKDATNLSTMTTASKHNEQQSKMKGNAHWWPK